MEIRYSHGGITSEEVVKFLGLTGQAASIFAEIIKGKEVIKKAEDLGIAASDEELQQFADSFRSMHGLYAAGDMLDFLNRAGLTVDDFESFCEEVPENLVVSLPIVTRAEPFTVRLPLSTQPVASSMRYRPLAFAEPST